jgi:hypothetical protein
VHRKCNGAKTLILFRVTIPKLTKWNTSGSPAPILCATFRVTSAYPLWYNFRITASIYSKPLPCATLDHCILPSKCYMFPGSLHPPLQVLHVSWITASTLPSATCFLDHCIYPSKCYMFPGSLHPPFQVLHVSWIIASTLFQAIPCATPWITESTYSKPFHVLLLGSLHPLIPSHSMCYS